MVPIKVSRGGLEGIGNRYTGIQISSLLAFLLLVTLLFGLTYTHTHIHIYIYTYTFSEERKERWRERKRRIEGVMEKGYGRGERERGGGERMKDREEGVEVTVEGRKWRRTRAEKIKRGLKSGD